MKRLILAIMVLLVAMGLQAKVNVKTVEGEATFFMPHNMSLAQGKEEVVLRAKVDALNAAFGNSINVSITSIINDQGDSKFYSNALDLVQGEWIETIGTPIITTSLEGNDIVLYCKIKGRAREKEIAEVPLDIRLLRNGTTLDCESTDFRSGNKMYLHFKTPVDGYVCVYQYDPKADAAFCLLPYRRDGNGCVKVQHDKDYIFFSKAHAEEPRITDEYRLACDEDGETNTLYVVFSTREFSKSLSTESSSQTAPNSVNFETFNQWTSQGRAQDSRMQVVPIDIILHK